LSAESSVVEPSATAVTAGAVVEEAAAAADEAGRHDDVSREEINAWVRDVIRQHAADPQVAVEIADTAIAAVCRRDYPVEQARALRARGMANGVRGDIDAAGRDFEAALALARTADNLLLQAQCLHGLAQVARFRGNFGAAIELSYRTVALRRQIGDPAGLAGGLGSLAALFGLLGDYPQATELLLEALEVARNCPRRHEEVTIRSNLAVVRLECGELAASIREFEAVVRLCEEVGHAYERGNTLINLAHAYLKACRIDDALRTAEEAIAAAQALGNTQREIAARNAQAAVLLEAGEIDAAEAALAPVVQLCESGEGTSADRVRTLYLLGQVRHRRGDLPGGWHLLEEALALAQEFGHRQETADVCLLLSRLCAEADDFAAALHYHQEYHTAFVALEKQAANRLLLAESIRNETARARDEAEIHRLRTIELAKANERNAELVRRLEAQTEMLARQALQDTLTGLYNRRYLNEFLENEIATLPRQPGTPRRLSLALLDVDDFKRINDTYSHQVGDRVLERIASILRAECRPSDVPCRYGGEEFVVVFPGTSGAEARGLCERLRAAIEEHDWETLQPGLRVTVSIGVGAGRTSSGGNGAYDLLHRADMGLYRAKRSGKNRVA
jgi:diguanylate cyclase (GGDEF) domain